MTDREALRSMLIYAQREAEEQGLDLTAYLLSLSVASLVPEGLWPDGLDVVTPGTDADRPHVLQDEPLQ